MTRTGFLLAIESSTSRGSVAVGTGDDVLAEVSIGTVRGRRDAKGRGGHSSALLPAIDYVLSTTGVAREELDGVVVGSGPGSFTGVRIAGATAKGIVHALDLPLLSYSSLLAAAASWVRNAGTVGAMFDARGRDVFAACYRFDGEVRAVVDPAAMPLDEALSRFRDWGVETVTGDAVIRHAEEIAAKTGAAVAPTPLAFPRAAALLWLAAHHPQVGAVPDAAGWEPDYLRPSGAERIAEQRAASTAGEPGR